VAVAVEDRDLGLAGAHDEHRPGVVTRVEQRDAGRVPALARDGEDGVTVGVREQLEEAVRGDYAASSYSSRSSSIAMVYSSMVCSALSATTADCSRVSASVSSSSSSSAP